MPISVFHALHILCRRPAGAETVLRQSTAGEQYLLNRKIKTCLDHKKKSIYSAYPSVKYVYMRTKNSMRMCVCL